MSQALEKKPRPAPDVRFVLHPETDSAYVHFADAAAAPFDARAARPHRRNAWWLIDAALLTYWNPADAIPRFGKAGLDAQGIDVGGVQCYVATTATAAIVAFRGTQPDEWSDVFDDALALLVPWDRPGTFVHAGFKLALERIWPALHPVLAGLGPTRRIWFTGHSLGAALATLAADRYEDPAGLVTIGSPRVGGPIFAHHFNERFGARALRYVNSTDVVTHVPPPLPLPYKHVDQLRQIARDGHVSPDPPRLDHFVADLIGDTQHLAEVMDGLEHAKLHRAPRFLLDHMPRGYAVDAWNDFVANGD